MQAVSYVSLAPKVEPMFWSGSPTTVCAGICVAIALMLIPDLADARRRHHRHSATPEHGATVPEVVIQGYRGRLPRRLSLKMLAVIPPDWRREDSDPSGRERRFVSPDGSAAITFSSLRGDEQSRDEYLKRMTVTGGEDVWYLRREPDRLVVFGRKGGDRNFYRKVILACRGHDWRETEIEYPAAARDYERLIEHVSAMMDVSTEMGCWVVPPASSTAAFTTQEMRCISGSVPKWVKADLRIRLALGAEIPRHVKLLEFPPESLGCSPKISRLRYIVVEDDVVIVDPSDYSIVATLPP